MAVSSRGKLPAFWLSLIGGFALVASLAVAETITLKNGVVYRGSVDKDNTIVSIFDTDGLKRVIIRDSKIASICWSCCARIASMPPRMPCWV